MPSANFCTAVSGHAWSMVPPSTYHGADSAFTGSTRSPRPLGVRLRVRPLPLQNGSVMSRSGQKPRLIAPSKVPAGACTMAAYASVAPEE
jgi:hypothetical protein